MYMATGSFVLDPTPEDIETLTSLIEEIEGAV